MKTNWNVTRKFQLTSSSGISGQSSKQGILTLSFIKSIPKAQSFGFRFVHTNPFLTNKLLYILACPKREVWIVYSAYAYELYGYYKHSTQINGAQYKKNNEA